MSETKWTWDDLVKAKVGKVFHDEFDDGIRFVVLRGPCHPCAYLGIALDHPLAGHDYDDMPITCHGGLTYSREGDGRYLPIGYWWYGWDYGHCDDYVISGEYGESYAAMNEKRTKWPVEKVIADSCSAMYEFKKLVRLAERIARRPGRP